MKTIGLLGGMSWESTTEYYKIINRLVKENLGGLHSARIVLYSVDFEEVAALQRSGDWAAAAELMVLAARRVEMAGADCLLICTNTMHKLAPEVEQAVRIPLLHIADVTAAKLKQSGITCAGLLGTKFTMEQDFYRARLSAETGLKVVIPEENDRALVHSIIFDELCKGIIRDESRRTYQEIVMKLEREGAQGIVLGCTEIGLLLKERDCRAPLFDTTEIHAAAAVEFALGYNEAQKHNTCAAL